MLHRPSSDPITSPETEKVFRVSELNRAVRFLLEDRFTHIWVEGELSDVTRAASGHYYFTLNDEEKPAQLRCVMFRSDVKRLSVALEDGVRLCMKGSLSLFEPRGSYQFIAKVAKETGQGDLHRQFELIRKKLLAEGLFDPERKRALPLLPRVIGVVTSTSGAALYDIVRVSAERCPVRIVVSPCLVQGIDAPQSLVSSLTSIQRLKGLDVVIITRGGGSAEDLFPFNSEVLARSVASCRVPVVSAVGHEVDITICDLAADIRAATPSNAAELVVPEKEVLLERLSSYTRSIEQRMEVVLMRQRLLLDNLSQRLHDPRKSLAAYSNRLQSLDNRVAHSVQKRMGKNRSHIHQLHLKLSQLNPRLKIARNRASLNGLTTQFSALAQPIYKNRQAQLTELTSRLQALSPLAVLSRGYAIALHEHTGKALLRAEDAKKGDRLTIRLHRGQIRSRVE